MACCNLCNTSFVHLILIFSFFQIFPRRPYYIWQEIIKYFNLTEAQMVEYFGPCPPNPDA